MKTTIELPDALMREVKLRAVHEGRKLKDIVADLLRKGMAAPEPGAGAAAYITTDPDTGLPLIKCRRPAPAGSELTPSRVAEILLDQEVARFHDAGRN